mgnify:CR=1 FL=1|jgi:glycosyltransferase involved in cell wall biosynthesis|tara:strand:- start:1335 stop:2450 length:1116 start_codon:yes stop_codon:yes gene_type:complete
MNHIKKNVLVDTYHLNNSVSGIGTYTINLCLGIRKIKSNDFQFIEFPKFEKSLKFNFFKGPISWEKKILSHLSYLIWKQIVLPIAAIYYKADFIYSTDFISPYFCTQKKITVLHDTLFWEYPKNYNYFWRSYFVKLIELTLKKSDLILATSNYTKTKIKKILAPKCNIETVYQCAKALNKTNNSKAIYQNYLLHVGTFDNRKNIQTLVKAFSLIRKTFSDLNLVLVGSEGTSTTNTLFEEIKLLISDLKLEKCVYLTGYVTNNELSNLYENASCYIFPSLDEGFGIPILEAQFFGLPVIVSNRGALSEIGGKGVLAFDSLDPVDLQSKVESVLSDDKLRKNLIDKGLENFNRFNIENFTLHLIKALKTVQD